MIKSLQRSLARLARVPRAVRQFGWGQTAPIVRRRSLVYAHSWIVDPSGRVVWAEPGWSGNIVHDEGEHYILVLAFDTDFGNGYPSAAPASLYIGLDNRAALAESDTLGMGGFNEVSGGGYARQAVSTATGFTIDVDGGDARVTSDTVVFTATGSDISTASNRFLTTAQSGTTGKLISSIPLNTPQGVPDGSSLGVNLRIKAAE